MSDLKVDGVIASTGTNTNLTLQGKGSGKVAIGDGALLFPDADGSADQIISTNASGVLSFVTPSAGGLTLGTEQATTSGTSKTFSSIPSGTKMIIIMYEGVSGGGDFTIQIGDSDGLETSGYLSEGHYSPSAHEAHTDGFAIINTGPGDAQHGSVMLTLKDSSNFTWVAAGLLGTANNNRVSFITGVKSLSAELTQLALISGSTYDAGSVNIAYM